MHFTEIVDTLPVGVFPRSYYVLRNADVLSCHEILDLRHPFSIYSLSLTTIRQKTEHLLDHIGPLYLDPQPLIKGQDKFGTMIREGTDSLLDALMEHFDDCCNVLRCFLDQGPEKQKRKVISSVQKDWNWYRGPVATIVNKIKHNQRYVKTIVFYGNSWSVPGYFIEGPAKDGIIGPDRQIHPLGGAFSFRRNLLFHLCGLYAVSKSLAMGLSKVDPRFGAGKYNLTTAERGEEEWCKMLGRVQSLSPLVFPDEVRKPNPVVQVRGSILRVEYPARDRVHSVPQTGTITTSTVVDPVSLSFRVPYAPIR